MTTLSRDELIEKLQEIRKTTLGAYPVYVKASAKDVEEYDDGIMLVRRVANGASSYVELECAIDTE